MNNSEIQIFRTNDGKTEIKVKLENETVWLNQYQLESLFETNRTSINKHNLNIYKSNELDKSSTCAEIAQVQQEGNRKIKTNSLAGKRMNRLKALVNGRIFKHSETNDFYNPPAGGYL